MNDAYMFQNRFSANIGGYGIGGRFAHGLFDGPSSAQYRQFHEMKAEMPTNQVGFLKAPVKPKCRSLDPILTMGINLMQMFQIPNLQLMQEQKPQTRDERLARIARQKKVNNQNRISSQIKQWNPFQDYKIQSDPQKTLFVGRLNYDTTEKTLKFEFEKYGIIKKVTIVKDKNGRSCGYGFIEFDSKDDFLSAYKQGNNRKIDGRRVIVDYERGRSVLNWRPRRLGGGKGQTRLTKDQLQKHQQQQKQKKLEQRKQKQKRPQSPYRSRSRSAGRKQRKRDNYQDRDRKYRNSRERKDKKDKKDRRDRER